MKIYPQIYSMISDLLKITPDFQLDFLLPKCQSIFSQTRYLPQIYKFTLWLQRFSNFTSKVWNFRVPFTLKFKNLPYHFKVITKITLKNTLKFSEYLFWNFSRNFKVYQNYSRISKIRSVFKFQVYFNLIRNLLLNSNVNL